MENEIIYDIFISYQIESKPLAQKLTKKLEAKGKRVWLDPAVIYPREDIPIVIMKGIRHSESFIVLLSKKYFESKWCCIELSEIMKQSPRRKIILVNIDLQDSDFNELHACPMLRYLNRCSAKDLDKIVDQI